MRHGAVLAALLIATAAHAELPSANDAVIRAALLSGKPTVADFGARSCIPCKKMAPLLEALNLELKGKANVLFTDVWATPGLAKQYRVQMIPTQIFFNAQGKEVKRHMGFMDRQGMLKELTSAGLK
ncbi:MAG: thioredoxin family protein [Desulfuromonadaceae bacterium]